MRNRIILQTCIGLLFWLSSFLFMEVSIIERLLIFGIAVTVPLTFLLTEITDRYGNYFKTYSLAVKVYPIVAISAIMSFFFPLGFISGLWTVPWLIWVAIVFLYGVQKLMARGFHYIEEISIDIGLIYLLLGGVWLSIFRFGINVLDFGTVIISLTAIHFHFSSFVTPRFAGLLGRLYRQQRGFLSNPFKLMLIGIMISSFGIAIGITVSRIVEFIFVGMYAFSLWGYTYYLVFHLYKIVKNKMAYALLSISSLTLIMTMFFALMYGFGRMIGIDFVTIPQMVDYHGLANAFIFVFLGVIGWLIVQPKMYFLSYGIPFSNINGKRKIGSDFFQRQEYMSTQYYSGLVERLDDFNQTNFNSNIVSPRIRHFYEQTIDYDLQSLTYWQKGFQRLSNVYKLISSRVEQINLPSHDEEDELTVRSEIIGIDDDRDGRDDVRAWVRTSKSTEKAVFVAAYSHHSFANNKYINISLPLPFGHMTGILRLVNGIDDRLELTSKARSKNKGDEGIYYVTKWFSIKLPISEHFTVWEEEDYLKANHEMWILGKKFLTIDYSIYSVSTE
ncbi:YndJ family protein [Oceanobacillus sp. ISL-73]|uniref:YndJ family protein n=2 Tax=unclassified Oceanobacillus TaxID=2630292 RepID=UPI001BE79450|nr:YndJ family protein [Oceanobacillus sp. ISL-73]MBT2651027.1 YndJ family protein [Oceanobacillus sp. ISL-73]